MNEHLDWDHLRTFQAVLEEGGLSQAARRLDLSQPSVGRHIDSLEASVGGALFTRSRMGMTPTALALRLAPDISIMANAAAALARAAVSDEVAAQGRIRLTAPEIMAEEVLPPMLTSFVEKHPGIEFEMVASNAALDLLTREADMAIRTVRPDQNAVVARKAGDCGIKLFAHRDYLARHGTPQTLQDLQTHRMIGYDRDPIMQRHLTDSDIRISPDMFQFRSDSETTQLAMLRAGFGIGGSQVPLAARDPALVVVVPDIITLQLEVWIAMHERLKNSLPMRLLSDHLAVELKAYCEMR